MINLKSKKMAECKDQLFTQIQHAFADADSFKSEQGINYKLAWDYYLQKLPVKTIDYGSDYIEPVLREAVDRILPQQLNIFTASEAQAVAYRPLRQVFDAVGKPVNTSLVAEAVNAEINKIFLRENNGYEVLNESFTEVLVSGGAFVKWFIEETYDEEELNLQDWIPANVITPLLQEFPDTDLSVLESKEVKQEATDKMGNRVEVPTMMVKGKLELLKINRNLKVTHANFNEVFVDENAMTVEEARYLCHRQVHTVGELLEIGFDEEAIKSADLADEGSDSLNKKDILVNGVFTNDSTVSTSVDPMERRVYLYEHYIYSSMLDKKGKTKLYQVFATNKEILEVYEKEAIPFAYGKGLTIPGSFLGNSMFNICRPYQDAISHFVRMNMNNITKRIHGRYYAVKGAYDVNALATYKPEGIVEVASANAVVPEPTHGTPPDFETMMSRVSLSCDRSVGLQSGNQLETKSLNNVNSNTIGMILSNQEIKDKRIAGTLARTLIKPMFEGIYRMLREEAVVLRLSDGSPFNTSNLPKLSNFAIDVSTETDDAQVVNTLVSAIQLAGQAASVPNSPLAIRPILTKIFKSSHITDEEIAQYIVPEQQPSEEDTAIMEAKKVLELDTLTASLENIKALTQKTVVDVAKAEVETTELLKDGASKRQREEEESLRKFQEAEIKAKSVGVELTKVENKNVIDRAELELEATQGRGVLIGK